MSASRSLRINRLVLTDVDDADHSAMVESFRAELSRLLEAWPDALPPHPARITGTSPADVGRRVATEVHARVVAEC